MENFFNANTLMMIALLTPIIVAVSEVIKRSLPIPTKLTPLINLALGIIGGLFLLSGELIPVRAIAGIVMGLTASGAYSSTKNILEHTERTGESKE